jgi:acyl-CoA thioesterase I
MHNWTGDWGQMTRYTALGDSITAGEAATRPNLSYPNLIVSMLAGTRKNEPASGQILAEPGWTSLALEHAVMQNPAVFLSHANAITIWVGGDDLAYAALAGLAQHNQNRINQAIRFYGLHLATLIKRIRSVSKATIIVCTQYNPFPNSSIAENGILALNAATTTVSEQNGALVAPTHEWFAGRESELIFGYRTGRIEDVARGLPIHPNNRGHEVIAKGLFPIILSSMSHDPDR